MYTITVRYTTGMVEGLTRKIVTDIEWVVGDKVEESEWSSGYIIIDIKRR